MTEFLRGARPSRHRSAAQLAAELERLRSSLATANPGGRTMILGEMANVARRLNNRRGSYRSNRD